MQLHSVGILAGERKENKQQADESAKQIKLLQGMSVCLVDPNKNVHTTNLKIKHGIGQASCGSSKMKWASSESR